MLPDLMNQARGGDQANYDFHQCGAFNNGASLISKAEQRTWYVSFNKDNLHYVILDEVDNLTDLAQKQLKVWMNRKDVVFILTTNYLPKVEKGVQNRCFLIEMNAAQPIDWLPLAQRVVAAYGGKPVPKAALLPVIADCDGSAREILAKVSEIALDRIEEAA